MNRNPLLRVAAFSFLLLLSSHLLCAQAPVVIQVDAGRNLGPLAPAWNYFGYDEPNYAYAPHGRELIAELAASNSARVQIRAHNLLTTGDGTAALKWGSTNAYTEDSAGRPVYDWKIVDKIFDTYLEAGAKPLVEIGFMPEALSTHPEPYRHHFPQGELFLGWTYPPKDYDKWRELVYQMVVHCVARYGKSEVAGWNWEVWNEPDILYWHGTPDEYDKLYDYAIDGVRHALPEARVGGPATTGPGSAKAAAFLKQFLEHCARGTNSATGKTGAPLDFISFHAKGAPEVKDGRVQMGLGHELRDVNDGLKIVASFPEFAHLPVILSEADPEGCAACSAKDHPQNAYRNGTLYPAYTAVAIRGALDLNERSKTNLAGYLTWAFEFEDQPYFFGYRTLATNGVDKPVMNLFRMLGMMAGERVEVKSNASVALDEMIASGVRGKTDVDGLATRGDHRLAVLLWNYRDEEASAGELPLQLNIVGVPAEAKRILVRHYRIDQSHSNSYTVWKAMGSPQSPTPEQYVALKAAGQLQLLESPRWVESKDGGVRLDFPMPGESVSLVEMSW
ncbi:MAG TPA: beta-xylosidase [Candidatus Binatia bacterium]|nr:beta-xylosidase [Candidatus Binatia bacterium]